MEYVIKILREEKQRLINQRQMFRLALTKNSIDSRNKIDDEISQIERAMVELSNVSQANELLPHVSFSLPIERFDAEDWLGENKDIWNHPIITDRNGLKSYEVADLMAEFANSVISNES